MKINQVVKQVVGIDLGKDEFYACFKVLTCNHKSTVKGTRKFKNTQAGLKEFYVWSQKHDKAASIPVLFVMEATGVYYENLAYYLHERGQKVSVLLAQKIKYFAKSCNLKTKTDKVDSKMIAEFGVERNLKETDLWSPPSKDFKMIRDLSREHTSLTANQTAAKAQIHALNTAHEVYPEVLKLKRQQLKFYEKQIAMVEKELHKLVDNNSEFAEKVNKIVTIKGIRFITVIKVLAETNGFLLFNNIRQLVSYAGLDVIEKESGKFKGKTKISKKGNARIRSALYMPAMTAAAYNSTLKEFYERVNKGRTIKRQGTIAVMRKLLILIYTLWKKNEEYDQNYEVNKAKAA